MIALIPLQWIISIQCLIYTEALADSSSCSWETPDGKVIDLSPLSTGTSPRFQDTVTDQYATRDYTWDPCRDVPCGGSPDVAACQISEAIPDDLYYGIADRSTAVLQEDSEGLFLHYTASSSRVTKVYLKCDPNLAEPKFTAYGEIPIGSSNFKMQLEASEACPGGNEPEGGLSAGSVLLIIFFVLIAVYIIAGILINIFILHESGTNAIPNKEFWKGCPGLISDGFFFTVNKVKRPDYQ